MPVHQASSGGRARRSLPRKEARVSRTQPTWKGKRAKDSQSVHNIIAAAAAASLSASCRELGQRPAVVVNVQDQPQKQAEVEAIVCVLRALVLRPAGLQSAELRSGGEPL